MPVGETARGAAARRARGSLDRYATSMPRLRRGRRQADDHIVASGNRSRRHPAITNRDLHGEREPPIWRRSRPVGMVFMPRPNGVFCTGAAVAARIYRWRRVGVGYSM